MENLVRQFFKCAVKGSYDSFNFAQFFTEYVPRLENKLAGHGMLTLEDYICCMRNHYDLAVACHFTYEGKHSGIRVTYKQVLTAIFRDRYVSLRNRYSKNKRYVKLLNLYNQIKEIPHLTPSELVILVDACIHAEHNGGRLINVDVESIRNECERNCTVSVS